MCTDVRVVQGATLRPLYVRMRGFESHFVHFLLKEISFFFFFFLIYVVFFILYIYINIMDIFFLSLCHSITHFSFIFYIHDYFQLISNFSFFSYLKNERKFIFLFITQHPDGDSLFFCSLSSSLCFPKYLYYLILYFKNYFSFFTDYSSQNRLWTSCFV